MKLKGKQRKYLRALAHHLKPQILVGKNNLSKGSIHSIKESLIAHELIKIKFIEKKVKDKSKTMLPDLIDCNIVGDVGKTLIVYRQNEDENKQKIQLPN